MALGVPIVSTPVDGLKALIEIGKNGYLSDDDAELARRIVEIAEDGELRARLSAYTLQKAKEINNVEVYRARLLAAYKTK
jgi:glycosyltransferase involved in cell wall biosynthesis